MTQLSSIVNKFFASTAPLKNNGPQKYPDKVEDTSDLPQLWTVETDDVDVEMFKSVQDQGSQIAATERKHWRQSLVKVESE